MPQLRLHEVWVALQLARSASLSRVLDFLRAFNRKERFFLLNAALVGFNLSDQFRDLLGEQLDLSVPNDAYVAMDYHLTWLYASLFLAAHDLTPETSLRRPFPNEGRVVRGNQEDTDLLVAFDQGDRTHLIVIEAKGVTGWTNAQLKSKAKRLREIFGETGAARANVIPHFVLTSPRRSAGLKTESWPAWMLKGGEVAWIPLPIPDGLARVSRSDERGRPSAIGEYWVALKGGPRYTSGGVDRVVRASWQL
jgi:hypothetical protein